MPFSKQDFLTLLLGLAVGAIFVLTDAAGGLSDITSIDKEWVLGVLTGVVTGAARYVATFLATKGFSRFDNTPPNQRKA